MDNNGNGTLDAGEDLPQFTQFDVDSRVGVNATHTMNPQQRAVTVAFVATERRQNRRGLYTSRLNFFGDGVNAFDPTTPGFLTTGVPALVVQEGQTIRDWKTGAQLNGNVQTFSVFDPLNNRDRGDLAFWVQMDTGEQAIVRARQVTILHLEFDPLANPTPQAQPIAAGLFANLGLMPGWATNFATFVASTGRGFVASTVPQQHRHPGAADVRPAPAGGECRRSLSRRQCAGAGRDDGQRAPGRAHTSCPHRRRATGRRALQRRLQPELRRRWNCAHRHLQPGSERFRVGQEQ